MKKSALLLALVVVFSACQNKSNLEKKVKDYTIDELTSVVAELDGEDISVEGMVVHVCKHGGQKMFISDNSEDQTVLVRVGSSIPEFDVALEGSQVKITGKIVITPAVDIEAEEKHDHANEATEDCEQEEIEGAEDCVTEEAHDQKNQETNTIKFHIEANSFKELEK